MCACCEGETGTCWNGECFGGGGGLPYEENFESLASTGATALSDAGWEFRVLVFDGTQDPPSFKYAYGGPAPNATADALGDTFISAVVTGEGGDTQGLQQLNVFSDYKCCSPPDQGHLNGTDLVETNVFLNLIPSIPIHDGETLKFSFDAKIGDLEGDTTAFAFIRTLDPKNRYATTNSITQRTDNLTDEWVRLEIELAITAELEGQLLQIGFVNMASDLEGSGVLYDNLQVDLD
jgi:hypothetical protein